MRIEINVNMLYNLSADPMVLLTLEAARTSGQVVVKDRLSVEFATLNRIAGEGGVGQRVWACVTTEQLQLNYTATVDVAEDDRALESYAPTTLHDLPGEVMTYLRPSRFCQSDQFLTFAQHEFGSLEGGQKVAAIRDWVAQELRYVPGTSHAETTVVDTFITREGVCRDFAHMVCALARASQIPARYASVYGPGVNPPDFHAVAQVWLEGAWHMVDATGMSEAGELVLIAVGRDAHDIAFMETQTPAYLVNQQVQVSRVTD
ncbi:MAG: transglutaminase-like domain-containing protein [Rhodobacterales bacterium]